MAIAALKNNQEIEYGYHCIILLFRKMKNKLCFYFSFNASLTIFDSKIGNKQLKLPKVFFIQIIMMQTLSETRT